MGWVGVTGGTVGWSCGRYYDEDPETWTTRETDFNRRGFIDRVIE